MKLFRKIVDEREELEMMRIERISFYVIFIALAVAIFIQVFALGFDFKNIVGEFIVLMIGAVCALAGYIRRGAWGYCSKPSIKNYLIYSLIAGIIIGIATLLWQYFKHGVPLLDCLRFFAINFICYFALTFLAYLLFGIVTKMRQKKLQQEYRDDK